MSIAESAKVIQRKSSVRSSGTIDYFKSDPKCMIEFREGRELKMTYRKGFIHFPTLPKYILVDCSQRMFQFYNLYKIP